MVTVETAKVYRGGRRRYFTRRAAERAHVRTLLVKRCECETAETDDCGRVTCPGYQCRFHDGTEYGTRVVDRYRRMFMRATPSPTKETNRG